MLPVIQTLLHHAYNLQNTLPPFSMRNVTLEIQDINAIVTCAASNEHGWLLLLNEIKGKPSRSILRYPITCKFSLTVFFTQPNIGLHQTADLCWMGEELQVNSLESNQIMLDPFENAKIGMIVRMGQVELASDIVKLFSCPNMWSPHVSSTLVIGSEMMQFNSKCVGVPTTSQEYSKVLGYNIHCTVEPQSLNKPYHSSVGLVKILDDQAGLVTLSVFANNANASSILVRKIKKIVTLWFKEICNITLSKDLLSDSLPFSVDLIVNFRTLDHAIDKQNLKLAVQHILHHFQKQTSVLGKSLVTAKEFNQIDKIKQFSLKVPATIVRYYTRHYGSQALEGLETKLKDKILSLLKNQ